jgi:hypothetical protein
MSPATSKVKLSALDWTIASEKSASVKFLKRVNSIGVLQCCGCLYERRPCGQAK